MFRIELLWYLVNIHIWSSNPPPVSPLNYNYSQQIFLVDATMFSFSSSCCCQHLKFHATGGKYQIHPYQSQSSHTIRVWNSYLGRSNEKVIHTCPALPSHRKAKFREGFKKGKGKECEKRGQARKTWLQCPCNVSSNSRAPTIMSNNSMSDDIILQDPISQNYRKRA